MFVVCMFKPAKVTAPRTEVPSSYTSASTTQPTRPWKCFNVCEACKQSVQQTKRPNQSHAPLHAQSIASTGDAQCFCSKPTPAVKCLACLKLYRHAYNCVCNLQYNITYALANFKHKSRAQLEKPIHLSCGAPISQPDVEKTRIVSQACRPCGHVNSEQTQHSRPMQLAAAC